MKMFLVLFLASCNPLLDSTTLAQHEEIARGWAAKMDMPNPKASCSAYGETGSQYDPFFCQLSYDGGAVAGRTIIQIGCRTSGECVVVK